MALEISVKQPNPTAGGYKSVNVYFNMNTGGIYFNGNVELPGKFATANDAEILEEIRKQIAVQMYTCLLYTSPSPRDATLSRMPSSA